MGDEFGRAVRTHREAAGRTMRDMGRRLGICHTLVRRTELGQEPPYSDRVLHEFCNALALSDSERRRLFILRIHGLGKLDVSGLSSADVEKLVELRDALTNANGSVFPGVRT